MITTYHRRRSPAGGGGVNRNVGLNAQQIDDEADTGAPATAGTRESLTTLSSANNRMNRYMNGSRPRQVEGELAEEFAGDGVHDADVEVLDE